MKFGMKRSPNFCRMEFPSANNTIMATMQTSERGVTLLLLDGNRSEVLIRQFL